MAINIKAPTLLTNVGSILNVDSIYRAVPHLEDAPGHPIIYSISDDTYDEDEPLKKADKVFDYVSFLPSRRGLPFAIASRFGGSYVRLPLIVLKDADTITIKNLMLDGRNYFDISKFATQNVNNINIENVYVYGIGMLREEDDYEEIKRVIREYEPDGQVSDYNDYLITESPSANVTIGNIYAWPYGRTVTQGIPWAENAKLNHPEPLYDYFIIKDNEGPYRIDSEENKYCENTYVVGIDMADILYDSDEAAKDWKLSDYINIKDLNECDGEMPTILVRIFNLRAHGSEINVTFDCPNTVNATFEGCDIPNITCHFNDGSFMPAKYRTNTPKSGD